MADVTLVAELRADINGYEKNIQSAVKTTVDGSKQIDVAAGKVSQAIKGINPASNSAAFALTNLGRVAQDAPFGFIGIQNNINPLLESFQRLKAESGSTGAALKALAGSLIGPAGLGLAVSLITAAITTYIQYQQKADSAVKNAKKTTDDYIATLDQVRQAQVKGEQSAAQETTRLDILYRATQNTTLSLKSRNAAYDELSSKYPKFFANSTDENRALNVSVESYNKLTGAILQAAYAKAYEDKIGVNANRQIEDRQKLVDLTIAESKARAEVNRYNQLSKGPSSSAGTGGGGNGFALLEAQAQKRLTETIEQKGKVLSDIAILEQRNGDLSKAALAAETAANFKTGQELDDKIKKVKAYRAELEQLPQATNKILTDDFLGGPLKVTSKVSTPDLTGFDAIIAKYNEIVAAGQAYANQQKIEKQNIAEINQLFGQGLVGAFQSAIQGTQSFVSAMGQFLGQLISRLLATLAAAVALSAVLSFTGIGALLGISSAGSSIGGLFKSLSGISFLAEGGITNGPTLAMIGEGKEREVVAPLSKFNAMVNERAGNTSGNVKFEISGNALRGVLQREDKSAQRTK